MGEEYILDRDFKASVRLNCQHFEFTNLTRHLLHPSIPAPDARGLRIADVATGTGIWAVEVARNAHPDTVIDGYDISAAQFPPPRFLPSNVNLYDGFDVFQDPPSELCGAYDVVHVRLIVLVVTKDPTPVIQNLIRLLRPGGYLQWSEIDVVNCEMRGPPECPRQALNQVLDVLSGPASTRHESWLHRLADHFKGLGLRQCRLHQYEEEPRSPFNVYVTFSRILAALEVSEKTPPEMMKDDKDDEQSFALICQRATAEVSKGSYCYWPLVTAIGQLPPSDE